METKWYFIFMITLIVAMFGSFGVESYFKAKATTECRVAFANTDKTVEQIEKLCKQ